MTTEHIEKFWRDATAADVARVMNGETVEARFRDEESKSWITGLTLGGWQKYDRYPWIDADLSGHAFCQVYDPPQRFLDKPDPGEGYRLLGKEPDEEKHRDDEIFREGKGWEPAGFDDGKQRDGFWYRRRIEQPKPEPKFAVGQRVRIIGGVCSQHVGLTATITDAANNDLAWSYFVKGGVGGWFREDCLKPVVEPEPKHYVLQVGDTVEFPGGVIVKVSEERGIFVK